MKNLLLACAAFTLLVSPAFAAPKTIYVDANGLVCDFCARALEKVFEQEEGVESVAVDLDSKVITISLKDGAIMDEDTVRMLITDSGYDVQAVRYE